MAAVRPLIQIPILRKLTRSVIRNCYVCKHFRAKHYPNPKPALLPRDKTKQFLPFEIVGTDSAGPFIISIKVKKILNNVSHYFTVVLAELYIWSSCQILIYQIRVYRKFQDINF